MEPGSQAWRERGSGVSPATPLQQLHITILVVLRAPSLASEAISFRGGMLLEASSGAEAGAEAGMPTPLTAATATAATTEVAALRTAAEVTEAVRRGGHEGAAPEAATGLAGSPSNLC